jgi:hypothetical protein
MDRRVGLGDLGDREASMAAADGEDKVGKGAQEVPEDLVGSDRW